MRTPPPPWKPPIFEIERFSVTNAKVAPGSVRETNNPADAEVAGEKPADVETRVEPDGAAVHAGSIERRVDRVVRVGLHEIDAFNDRLVEREEGWAAKHIDPKPIVLPEIPRR